MLSVQNSACAGDWSNDYEKRLQFTRSFLKSFRRRKKICSLLMTDDAHFHLNSFVNK